MSRRDRLGFPHEWLEDIEDRPNFDDEATELGEGHKATIAERYLDLGRPSGLHVHLRVGRFDSDREDWCISYERLGSVWNPGLDAGPGARVVVEKDLPIGPAKEPTKGGAAHHGHGVGMAVLVYVGVLSNDLQGFRLHPIRSVARLQRVDQCGRLIGDAPQEDFDEVGVLGFEHDWELVLGIRRAVVGENQRLDHVLERCSEVRGVIPKDGDPFLWGFWEVLDPDCVPPGLGVMIVDGFYRLRFGPVFDPAIQVVDMFLSPIENEADVFEGGHGGSLDA